MFEPGEKCKSLIKEQGHWTGLISLTQSLYANSLNLIDDIELKMVKIILSRGRSLEEGESVEFGEKIARKG